MLYALSFRQWDQQHAFEVMSRDPPSPGGDPASSTKSWSWRSVPSPPPFEEHEWVTSYAVDPDGCTIFMSVLHNRNLKRRIFSFDTGRSEWRFHGERALPFQGQGYYDSTLDAWVGLREDGYVCACQVAPRSGAMRPEWKIVKEKMFHKVPERKRAATYATLTYMGNARFCLVEGVVREEVEYDKRALGDCDGCMLHMTRFGLRYTHKGELQTTIDCTTSSYSLSKHITHFSPVAFWM
ncbi:uncharacterized protein LOC125547064 [Triticum urartu]|uniref:uncharacterized protein LOC125547064 n=1 Tax=Triticum urartu TaxID=4572 RepID=UPI0020446AF4|nr:uncharacterized protein LOC125547064 [Triticum urartu]